MNSWGGENRSAAILQRLLQDFMAENPDIKVKNESIWGDDFLPSIKTKFATGNDPDVFGLWPGSDTIPYRRRKVATDDMRMQTLNTKALNEKMWRMQRLNAAFTASMEIS
jgi:raffinose/stachyose/melibiose transport system substrate-binding protein